MKNLTLQQFLKLASPDDCRIFHTGNGQWEVRCHAGSYAPGVGLVDLLLILAGKGICCSVIEWDGLSKSSPTLAVSDAVAERQRQMDEDKRMMFQRECRYGVIKFTDANAALSESERKQLAAMMAKVEEHRIGQGKAPLECVVVEADWPIYENTWAAVEQMAAASN